MLSRNIKKCVNPKLIGNSYSTQTASKVFAAKVDLPEKPTQVTKCPNGVLVLSLENYSPISTVAFAFKSGTRYENVRNAGVSQKLKYCAGLKTRDISAFMHSRKPQQLGAKLYSNVGRETLTYGMTGVLREDLDMCFEHVSDIATQPMFRQWELDDTVVTIQDRNQLKCPMQKAIDMMHTAGFRARGLGNSLLIPNYNSSEITATELSQFWNDTHSTSRLAVVGFGVDHEDLAILAADLDTGASGDIQDTSKYGGGEVRTETDGHAAYVAVGGPSASSDFAALTVAKYALNCPKGVKYGENTTSILTQTIKKAGGSGSGDLFNIQYSDSGLFGFVLAESAGKAGDVVREVAKSLRSYKITEAELNAAKAKAKAAVYQKMETQANNVQQIADSLLFKGKYESPMDIASELDQVDVSAVNTALAKVMKGKPCMGAHGGIQTVPYLDEI